MKRLAALVVVAALSAVALSLPEPDAPAPLPERVLDEPTSSTRFAACVWAVADSRLDSFIALATEPASTFRLSFPSDGEVVAELDDDLDGRSGVALLLSQVLAQGLSPAIAEFDQPGAAAGVVTFGETALASGTCPSATPKVWHLPGGSTLDGQELVLHLFNPFPDDATVRLLAHSDLGVEAGLEERLRVPARSSLVVELSPALPQRNFVSLIVESELGDAVAYMSQSIDGGDLAVWPGVGQSEVWEFPLVSAGGLEPYIRISNDTSIPLAYEVDVFAPDEAILQALSGTLEPLSQTEVSLAEFGPAIGARVSADGPVSAVLVGEGELAWAVAPGVPATSDRWMVPGLGALDGARARLWILNSGARSVTVTYTVLDAVGFPTAPGKVTIPPETARGVPVDIEGAGLLVESPDPVSVAWSVEQGDQVGYASGVALNP